MKKQTMLDLIAIGAYKPKKIKVRGKRWFGRTHGATYHSVSVSVDGIEIACCPYKYGYNETYLRTAAGLLEDAGIICLEQSVGFREPLWNYCRRNKIELDNSVVDVNRKKDL